MRFHYLRASDDWWWQVDDVFLGEPTCAPAEGGLVVGHTRSTVTRKPLVGVEVKGARSPLTATSVRTPDDDGTPDGLYWLFAPGAGRQRLTATLAAHTDADTRVQVADSQTVRQDLGLESGRLEPVPRSLTVEVRAGKVAQRRVTLANTGDASLRYDLEEVPGRPVTATGAGDEWERVTPYPSPVSDSAAGVLDGTIYSFGGRRLRRAGAGRRLPVRRGGAEVGTARGPAPRPTQARRWFRRRQVRGHRRVGSRRQADGRHLGLRPRGGLLDRGRRQPATLGGRRLRRPGRRAVRRGRLRRERRLRPHGRAPLRPGVRRVDPGCRLPPADCLGRVRHHRGPHLLRRRLRPGG